MDYLDFEYDYSKESKVPLGTAVRFVHPAYDKLGNQQRHGESGLVDSFVYGMYYITDKWGEELAYYDYEFEALND